MRISHASFFCVSESRDSSARKILVRYSSSIFAWSSHRHSVANVLCHLFLSSDLSVISSQICIQIHSSKIAWSSLGFGSEKNFANQIVILAVFQPVSLAILSQFSSSSPLMVSWFFTATTRRSHVLFNSGMVPVILWNSIARTSSSWMAGTLWYFTSLFSPLSSQRKWSRSSILYWVFIAFVSSSVRLSKFHMMIQNSIAASFTCISSCFGVW